MILPSMEFIIYFSVLSAIESNDSLHSDGIRQKSNTVFIQDFMSRVLDFTFQ